MNALYNCAFADPWLDVANVLKNEHGIDPVYWIGYDDDNSKELIPEKFPGIVYHDYFNAWKGVFPEKIETLAQKKSVGLELYKKLAPFELSGLSIMDRMDMDWESFCYAERRMLFRKFLRYWSVVIDLFKIDYLISPTVPHRSFDYPLYLICKEKGIKIISFISTPFNNAGRIVGVSDIFKTSQKIKKEYETFDRNDKIDAIAEDIKVYIEKINKSYADAKPENFKEYNRFYGKSPSLIMTGRKFFYELNVKRSIWFGKTGWLWKGVPSYTKEKKKRVEESRIRLNLISYIFKIYKRIMILKSLKREYLKISVNPDLNSDYVIYALHYQPEATTTPKAGIFSDQLYVLELLSKHLPDDWNIYIKENPKQFNPIAEGNTGRMLRFYRDALKFPKVFFIAEDTDPFKIIDKSKAVITIAGTMGWESMIRKKPVICFGPAWYEHFTHGVLRIKDEDDLNKITDFIKNFKYSEKELMIYLKAVENNSFNAYFRRGLKSVLNINDKICINSLVEHTVKHFGLTFPKKKRD